ncbi:MAG: cupin domain-containing protein [Marmoricola sp.]
MPSPPSGHDQAAAVPDQDATAELSDAMSRLDVQGAIFLHGRYTESWAYRSVPGADAASMLAPGKSRVLLFHLITAGRCWVRVEGGERYWAEPGDVVVFPYGHLHEMGGTADAEVVDVRGLLPAPPWDEMPFIEHGGGGEQTHVLCGYLSCDDPLFDPDLQAFPPVFVVTPTGAAAAWVQASLEYVSGQITKVEDHFEAPTTITRLLLQEVLKLHLSSAPASERGFVRALSDPVVAPAMALIHRSPEEKWTVADLAARGSVSVSLLDERFRDVLGMPPIRYLTSWRMHVAQDLLTGTDLGVAAIARQVGYESEEAFSRAFKRKFDVPPSVWRRRA